VNELSNQSICKPVSSTSLDTSSGPPTTSIIANTGSTAHFGTTTLPVVNKRPATNPIAIHNPNGTIMYSTHTAELDIPHLPPAMHQVHIIPNLASHTLLSIGQMCDTGCAVTFNATTVTVTYQNRLILQGTRTATTRLWHFDLPHPGPPLPLDMH
jgi:hypothetical protein